MSEFSRPTWLLMLALCCALVLIGSIALLTGPARAQVLSGSTSSALSRARQSMEADLGKDSPFVQRGPERPHAKAPALADTKSQAGAQQQPAACTGWSLVSSPDPSSDFNQLYGTSGTSPKDIWAVGIDDSSGNFQIIETLIEHWDGRAWSVVPSPNPGGTDDELYGVVALNPRDAWAVGITWDGSRYLTLTEHWNGSVWSVVPSPNPGNPNNYLYKVDAKSPDDVWAVGTDHVDGAYGPSLVTLTEHWNGRAWSVVPSPNAIPGSARDNLMGVTEINRNDVWAVGISCTSYTDCYNGVITPKTLTEHWNGRAWSVVPSPNPTDPHNNGMQSVSASGPNDVWAVGGACFVGGCAEGEVLIEHWNGRAWSVVSNPTPQYNSPAYWGVLAIDPNDAWAVGSASTDGGDTWIDLVSHWDGRSWSQIPVTSPGAFDNDLRSLTAIGRNNVWAVGDFDNGNGEQTQVQHFGGPCK